MNGKLGWNCHWILSPRANSEWWTYPLTLYPWSWWLKMIVLTTFHWYQSKTKTFDFNLVLVSSEKISLYTLVEYKTMKQVYCFNIWLNTLVALSLKWKHITQIYSIEINFTGRWKPPEIVSLTIHSVGFIMIC